MKNVGLVGDEKKGEGSLSENRENDRPQIGL